MAQTLNPAIAVVGIAIGKNSFHVVGHDERGASWWGSKEASLPQHEIAAPGRKVAEIAGGHS